MNFKKWYKQYKDDAWLRIYNNLSLSNKILVKTHVKNIFK